MGRRERRQEVLDGDTPVVTYRAVESEGADIVLGREVNYVGTPQTDTEF